MLHFLRFLDSEDEPDHETVAFLRLLDSRNEPDHETVKFFEASRQQKRAGPRDCCIFFQVSRQQKRAGPLHSSSLRHSSPHTFGSFVPSLSSPTRTPPPPPPQCPSLYKPSSPPYTDGFSGRLNVPLAFQFNEPTHSLHIRLVLVFA